MNQILVTNLYNNNNNSNNDNSKIKKTLKFQLYTSIFFIFIISFSLIIKQIDLIKKENLSNELLDNYNITKLYSNLSRNSYSNSSNLNENTNSAVLGIIEIPNINLYYPVFSNYDESLLKIAPCKFYGPSIGKHGNLCIAGHNYDNDKFFSKLSLLKNGDNINMYDNYNQKFSYIINEIYEVPYTDTSPIYFYNKKNKQLTLVTCNNFNNNRIIVKALYK